MRYLKYKRFKVWNIEIAIDSNSNELSKSIAVTRMRKMLPCLKNLRPCSIGVFDRWAGLGWCWPQWKHALPELLVKGPLMSKLTKQLSRLIFHEAAVISKQLLEFCISVVMVKVLMEVRAGCWCLSRCHTPVPTFLSQWAIICNSDFLSDLLSTDTTTRPTPPPRLNTTQISNRAEFV